MSSVYEVPVQTIDGRATSLAEYAGNVLLIVNVASACGFTPQYEGLEALFVAQRERGLMVLGFPSNDFGAQEPGTSEEIVEFCSSKFHVDFPMFAKTPINGEARHPLYAELIAAQPQAVEKPGGGFREQMAGYGIKAAHDTDVLWNFEKFVVGRNGDVVARFTSDVAPDDPLLLAAIERELAKPA